MSIHVDHLTKVYANQKAIDNISFFVDRGEVVGFLGPNGAGKSTTFKIITGYLPASTGNACVDGYDVAKQPMHVKRIVGYLPEHNPLYTEMYVHEYLRFVGRLYGLSGLYLKNRVYDVVERCGLTLEQNKKIESLSKGYRQRVGLAQALVHNPSVLILDEPTSGLDPNQLVEIRKLIKEVSREKTVIFSTHIMQEVEALCDRVVIVNQGKIVANDRLSNLRGREKNTAYVVEFEGHVTADDLQHITGVLSITVLHSHTKGVSMFQIHGEKGADMRNNIFRFAADTNLSLIGLKQDSESLESIFQQLTKKLPVG